MFELYVNCEFMYINKLKYQRDNLQKMNMTDWPQK